MFSKNLLVLCLRTLSVGSRFLLTFYIAKKLSIEDLGVYAIMASTISIGVFSLGMEFYVFNLRHLPALDSLGQARCIRDQVIFHVFSYLIVLPLFWIVFHLKILPMSIVLWFYLLLVTEHISHDGYRLLITLSQPVAANIIFFIRSGFWVLILIGYQTMLGKSFSLTGIWIAWFCGGISSIFLLAIVLMPLPWKKALATPVNLDWIKSGVKVSSMYFFMTINFMIITYAGRYLLQIFNGEQTVGIFFFFLAISNTVLTFVDAGPFSIIKPQLIALYKTKQIKKYQQLFLKLCVAIVGSSFIFSLTLYFLLPTILGILDKTSFYENYYLLPILLVAVVLNCISLIPYISLFVQGRDRLILLCQFITTVISLAVNYILISNLGISGAAYAALISAVVLLLARGIAWVRSDGLKQVSVNHGISI